MKLSEILMGVKYQGSPHLHDCDIMNITTNPEECDKKTLLIITNRKKPQKEEALLKSAFAVVYDGEENLPGGVETVKVGNARLALAYAYSNFYAVDYSKMKVIGITGTNGKTSTARFLYNILTQGGTVCGLISTGKIMINDKIITDRYYSMTTPDPPLLYKSLKQMELSGCTHVIMEVSSHALALHKTAPIPFEYGLFTNLSPEHMDFHKDMEEYYKTKCRLLMKCKTAIINVDDKYGKRAYKEREGKKIAVGVLFRNEFFASCVKDKGFSGVEYLFHGNKFVFKVRLLTPGIYNVYNSILAIAATTDMGVKPCEVKKALETISCIEGRFEIIKSDVTVIIDYAHTDTALENILRSISTAKAGGRLVAVFGAGGERDATKRPRMAQIAEKYADLIIVTSDNPRGEAPARIISDILKGFKENKHLVIEIREDAIKSAILNSSPGDTVAIIGKGQEKYNIDKDGYHPFDEKDLVAKYLLERKRNENKT